MFRKDDRVMHETLGLSTVLSDQTAAARFIPIWPDVRPVTMIGHVFNADPRKLRAVDQHGRPLVAPYPIPDGHQLVPIEPTEAMVEAGYESSGEIQDGKEAVGCWRAMLEAAPRNLVPLPNLIPLPARVAPSASADVERVARAIAGVIVPIVKLRSINFAGLTQEDMLEAAKAVIVANTPARVAPPSLDDETAYQIGRSCSSTDYEANGSHLDAIVRALLMRLGFSKTVAAIDAVNRY